MSTLDVTVHIRRSPDVVRKWWLDFPEVYENAKEQPHKIVTRSRSAEHIDTLTYWRAPFGRELEIPERFALRPDGWDVEIELPFGLAQRDVFTLTPEGDGTRVDIAVDIWCRTKAGWLALRPFKAYARRQYPKTWRAAVRWCEKATAESV